VVARGIIINGLPIVTEADKFDVYYLPDLDKYYAGCVIGGPGAFIQVANGFADLARALRRKLVLENFGCVEAQRDPTVREGRRRPAADGQDRSTKRLRYRRTDALRRVYSTSVGRSDTSAALE
jgi:hypothetical protein